MTREINHIVIDIDGCLVDNKQDIDEEGRKISKKIHCRDTVAIKKLLEAGYKVTLITNSSWLGMELWSKKLGCDYIYCKGNKADHEGINWDEVLSVGDDYWLDKDMLDKSKESCVVRDADIRLREYGEYVVLDTKGGDGIVNELIYRYDLI